MTADPELALQLLGRDRDASDPIPAIVSLWLDDDDDRTQSLVNATKGCGPAAAPRRARPPRQQTAEILELLAV
jgi:hypothetical protein